MTLDEAWEIFGKGIFDESEEQLHSDWRVWDQLEKRHKRYDLAWKLLKYHAKKGDYQLCALESVWDKCKELIHGSVEKEAMADFLEDWASADECMGYRKGVQDVMNLLFTEGLVTELVREELLKGTSKVLELKKEVEAE